MMAKKSPEQLLSEILDKLNHIYPAAEQTNIIYLKIKKNVFSIYNWLPKKGSLENTDQKYHTAYQSLENALIILNAVQCCFVHYAVTNPKKGTGYFIDNIFQGGHLLLDDNGAFFNMLNTYTTFFQRHSSHYYQEKEATLIKKGVPKIEAKRMVHRGKLDFSMRAEVIFNELLINKVEKNGKTYSWFQMEGHSHAPRTLYQAQLLNLLDKILQYFSFSLEKLGHQRDWLRYVWNARKKNIGQYGVSEYTEANPLTLQPH